MTNKLLNWKLNSQTITVIYLVIGALVPTVKLFFLWSTLYIFILWWLNKSWEKTLIYGFWPLLFYYVGQLYVFQSIRPEQLNHPLYPDGRSLYFKFTPAIAFGLAVIVSWLFKINSYEFKSNWIVVTLLGLTTVKMLSTVQNGSILPTWMEFLRMASNLSVVVWFWWLGLILRNVSKEETIDFWVYWLTFIKTSLWIGAVIVLLQFGRRSTLGLIVEQTQIIPYFGAGSDELSWWIRPVGISGHANGMAILLLSQLLAWTIVKIKLHQKIFESWIIVPITAIVLLQSRAVLLGLGGLVGWWWYFKGKKSYQKKSWENLQSWQKKVAILLVGIFSIILVNRGWVTVLDTGNNSGWDTRSRLAAVATRLIQSSPWLGIGEGNFVPAAFSNDLTGDFRRFPEPVHNGFLLIISEQGIIGFGLTVIFWLLLFSGWWRLYGNKMGGKGLVLVCGLSQIVWMLFQPVVDIFPVHIIVVVLLLTDELENKT